MTRTRLNTRLENIEKLTNFKNDEKKEMVRLTRKMGLIEPLIYVNYTITGNIEEMEMEISRIKRERKEAEQKMQKIWNMLNRTKERIYNYKTAIQRLQQLTYMEEDIEFYYWYGKQTKLFSPKKNNKNLIITDPLLLQINNLPDELMNVIQEYFTYETKTTLLESKYDPLKMLNKFNSRQIGEIINTIFNNYVLNLLDNDTRENILFKFTTFYGWGPFEHPNLRLKRNITDERVFLKNIVLSFKPNHHTMLFGLYKFIILLHKIIF